MYPEAMRGLVDEHGVRALGRWFTDEVIYCVLRAPSLRPFCRHPTDHNLPCDDVHPIAGTDTEIVRAAITELWPGDQRIEIAS